MHKNIIGIGIILFLFLFSAHSSMTLGHNNITTSDNDTSRYYNFDRYLYPEYYDYYNEDEITNSVNQPFSEFSDDMNVKSGLVTNPDNLPLPLDGPMDSAWPMYCHDVHHTGRSPYSTADSPSDEKWKFWTELSGIQSGIVISEDETIYFSGSYDFYAVYRNGTLKWRYVTGGVITSCPAVDENGVIYIGTAYDMLNGDHLYALYPNGTLKWKYFVGDSIFSSPAIDADGSIYFGSEDDYIYALYPNGTLKWKYLTSVAVYSSPAIGDNETIYCGSHDTYLYAIYPNNGTLKWRYKTGHWIRTSPCIGDDGTIYVVSLDNYLHAVNPDGTQKWITNMGEGGTSPTIGQDGTIYAGYRTLHAIDPVDGSVKWTFDVGGTMRGGTPCNSVDGTIYVGTSDGGELIAISPNGTLKWRKGIGTCESAPAIGNDGTIYIGSLGINDGYLYAFGKLDPNYPSAPDVIGSTKGKPRISYEYTFKSMSPLSRDIYYYIDWGDNTVKDWFGPFDSGEEVKVSHTWSKRGTYTIKARAKDTDNLWGPWGTLTVTMPKDLTVNLNTLLLKLVEKFTFLERLLYLIK